MLRTSTGLPAVKKEANNRTHVWVGSKVVDVKVWVEHELPPVYVHDGVRGCRRHVEHDAVLSRRARARACRGSASAVARSHRRCRHRRRVLGGRPEHAGLGGDADAVELQVLRHLAARVARPAWKREGVCRKWKRSEASRAKCRQAGDKAHCDVKIYL